MKLKSLLDIASELQLFYDDEVAFGIHDIEKVLCFYPSPNLKLNVKAGDPVPKGGTAQEAISTGQRVIKRVPKEVLGFPYVGIVCQSVKMI